MGCPSKSRLVLFAASILTSISLFSTVFAGAYPSTAAESTGASDVTKPGDKISLGAQRLSDNTDGEYTAAVQSVVYENVETRRYEGEDGHPYIHDIRTNNTTRNLVSCQRGMLAFDKDGNPLKIDWFILDTDIEAAYFYLHESDTTEIDSGETDDVFGGWSLNPMGKDPEAPRIAYVLYCDKEITFEDGSVWENPGFDNWRFTYEGKKIDVSILESYYPYEQKIEF